MVDWDGSKIELKKLRELFVKRMTIDSDHHDRRRRDYNQAIFHYESDEDVDLWNENAARLNLPPKKYGETYPCWNDMDMDMVLKCWDDAVKDYFTERDQRQKVFTHTREGNSDA